MKKLLTFTLFTIIFFLSNQISSQSIQPSMLEGLSPAQIEILKNQFEMVNSGPEPGSKIISESTIKETSNIDINESENKKYGYDYFSSVPTSITAVGDLPLPNDYKISLNDQFTVILSGSKRAIFDLNVNLDGTILFPELGSISVVGETFQEVKIKLRNLIQQSYIGVQIDLSLKNLSAKKITIVGAVKTPGTYLVNPFSTISNALGYSGGISEIGTLRNIRLIRTNGRTYNFDLYKLLINGDRSDDITIESGDVIVIDPAKQFISLSGQVKRPAIYEIKEDETLRDLIGFGLGFTQIANKTNISLQVLDIESSSLQNIIASSLDSDLSRTLDVNVNQYISKNISSINISGAVKEPGLYEFKQNATLKDLIEDLEFVDVYPWLAVINQFDEDNLLKTSTLFSLKDPDTYDSIKLLPNSELFFANINTRTFNLDEMTSSLIKEYELRINHKQGTFNMPVYGKYSVKSFIDFLGLDMTDVENKATYISPLENIVIVDDYQDMKFTAQKYNNITFRSPVNDLISVTISGAVDFPGTYTLQAYSSLQDLYKLVGNFKRGAFLEGIIYTKESIRERQIESIQKSKEDLNRAILTSVQQGATIEDINIIRALSESIDTVYLGRLAGNFMPGSSSSLKTILSDGDTIIVPRNPNAINVLGEVLNPIAFEYNNKLDVRSAIINAGGYKDYADKGKVYVIRANGLIEKANKNIFVRNVVLKPGDTVVVPRRIITNNSSIELLLPYTQIFSDLAFSAAALENLSNNK